MENAREILIEKMVDNLPILRKKLKLSQEGLAQIIGTSRFTVMLIETKKRAMTWNMFLSLAFVFDNNKSTALLLRVLGIYDSSLEDLIVVEKRSAAPDADF